LRSGMGEITVTSPSKQESQGSDLPRRHCADAVVVGVSERSHPIRSGARRTQAPCAIVSRKRRGKSGNAAWILA